MCLPERIGLSSAKTYRIIALMRDDEAHTAIFDSDVFIASVFEKDQA